MADPLKSTRCVRCKEAFVPTPNCPKTDYLDRCVPEFYEEGPKSPLADKLATLRFGKLLLEKVCAQDEMQDPAVRQDPRSNPIIKDAVHSLRQLAEALEQGRTIDVRGAIERLPGDGLVEHVDMVGQIKRVAAQLTEPERVYVREQLEGKWGSHALTELPADKAIAHVVRFFEKAIEPEE